MDIIKMGVLIHLPNIKRETMSALEQLKSFHKDQFVTGEGYQIALKPGLTSEQISQLAHQLPGKYLPVDIRELLSFASGFELPALDEVTFDAVGQFGFENIFPFSVQLAGDGFGNFWILDIDSKGNWGTVFYVCHDPAVVVKHSKDLAEFIKHVQEFYNDGPESGLDIIHEKIVMDIWQKDNGFIDIEQARNSGDAALNNFAVTLPDNFVIADLRSKPNMSGFAWGKFGPDIDNAVRYNDEVLWAFEKKTRKGLLSKLFGRR